MTLNEHIYAQAVLLAGENDQEQLALLEVLCAAASSSLAARLREGLTPEDCRADFVAAASLLALSSLNSVAGGKTPQQITAGDLTVRSGSGDAASRCLRQQAELMMAPYVKDRFAFVGV